MLPDYRRNKHLQIFPYNRQNDGLDHRLRATIQIKLIFLVKLVCCKDGSWQPRIFLFHIRYLPVGQSRQTVPTTNLQYSLSQGKRIYMN